MSLRAWLFLCALLVGPRFALAERSVDPRLQCFQASYPRAIDSLRREGARSWLVLSDGARVPFDDGKGEKSPAERLEDPDLEDTIATGYPAFDDVHAPE